MLFVPMETAMNTLQFVYQQRNHIGRLHCRPLPAVRATEFTTFTETAQWFSFSIFIKATQRMLYTNLCWHWYWRKSSSLYVLLLSIFTAYADRCNCHGISVCPSVRHVPVFCPDKWRYDRHRSCSFQPQV